MSRPREFDVDQVLEQAMYLFWRQGYHHTSLQELEKAMAINRFSIYATFHNKHSLFLAALERYQATVISHLLRDVEVPNAGLEALNRFFTQFIALAQTEMGRRGCFICNSATELAPHDPDVAQAVEKYKERIMRAFHHALANAQRQEELAADTDLQAMAIYLLGSLFGLMIYMKTHTPPGQLSQYVQAILNSLR